MARSNVELPQDLVTEILLKLPVKSIIRFKCVAKTWHRLFTNPTFVSKHDSLSKKNKGDSHNLIVHYKLGDDYLENNLGMLSFADNQTLVSYHDLHQQVPLHLADKDVSLAIGDGLVCAFDFTDSGMTLWNPATKEFRILPDCYHCIPRRDECSPPFVACGMDPSSNDYKVLYIRMGSCIDFRTHYAIYSMSNDSWRALTEEEVIIFQFLGTIYPSMSNACVNGAFYWEVCPSVSELHKVLTFNLSTEVFQLLRPPIPGTYGTLIPLHDDRISFWESPNCDKKADPFTVWVLNDEENWTKLINIDPSPENIWIYGFWTHGKVFVEFAGHNRNISLYDLETKEFSDPGFEAGFAKVYNYEESLIALHQHQE